MKHKVVLCLALVLGNSLFGNFAAAAQSQWVCFDSDGKLAYKTLPDNDRIMDFSYAGYMGGGVKIPSVPVAKTIFPSGRDDTATIQNAIDDVSQMPLMDGFRGAVLLGPGTFICNSRIVIKTNGILLRGSGPKITTIQMTGDSHTCITVGGTISPAEFGAPIAVTDDYVPAGAMTFHVADASSLSNGDAILICRPVTGAWIQFMGMDKLVRNHKPERWMDGRVETHRIIRSISGNAITVDVPLSDSLDAKYLNPPGATIVRCSTSNLIDHIGLENFRIASPPQSITIEEKQNKAVTVDHANDVWIRNVTADDTINSIYFGHDTRRVTVANVQVNHTVETKGAALPADFTADGTQILLNHCSGHGSHLFYFVTLNAVTGPNVLLNCDFYGNGHIQPHARWATGLLVDNCHLPNGGVDLMNRGIMGSGHGWTVGWAVLWNCSAKSFIVQQPPGSANWAIGCIGAQEHFAEPGSKIIPPQGFIDSGNHPVTPTSLYLEQLRERLGDEAVKNVND
jgi:hypothetical protein